MLRAYVEVIEILTKPDKPRYVLRDATREPVFTKPGFVISTLDYVRDTNHAIDQVARKVAPDWKSKPRNPITLRKPVWAVQCAIDPVVSEKYAPPEDLARITELHHTLSKMTLYINDGNIERLLKPAPSWNFAGLPFEV